jgi:hypothetical protein
VVKQWQIRENEGFSPSKEILPYSQTKTHIRIARPALHYPPGES